MNGSLAQVLRLLPSLSEEELAKVRQRVQALTSPAFTTKPVKKAVNDYLLEGIHYHLRVSGLIGQRQPLLERLLTKEILRASDELRAELEAYMPGLDDVEKMALGRLVAKAMADWLKRARVPVGQKTMLQTIPRALECLDASYPNYLQRGWLPSCWSDHLTGVVENA